MRALERRYGLALEVRERLAGGYANDVFRVDGPAGALALRIEHPPLRVDDIAWEHGVVSLLGKRLAEVPAPIPARDGTTFFRYGRFAVWLLPFVDGSPGDRDDERHRLEAATLLGRLHRVAGELAVPPAPARARLGELEWPEAVGFPGPLAGEQRRIERARTWAIDFTRALEHGRRRLASGVVHGDFFPGNVLFSQGRAVALVDWEEAHVDWTAYELATAVWEFCKRNGEDDLDRAAAARFVAAYRAAGGPARETTKSCSSRSSASSGSSRSCARRPIATSTGATSSTTFARSRTLPERLYAGCSGFSFASWSPGFYPPGAKPADFLKLYAERLASVELNNTFYRLPSEAQFERWAAATPPGFRFAVKMPMSISIFGRLDQVGTFCERVRALGDRLGPVLARLGDGRPRDDGFLRLLLDSLDADLQVAFDFRDPSWDGVEPILDEAGAVRVNALEAAPRFRYLRLREPPYDEAALASLARRLHPLLADGIAAYCYFKHEDEPTAPAYAARLAEMVQEGRAEGIAGT